MGLRISTNVQSLAAQRHLGVNNRFQKHTLEQLSSGKRIIRAADDAAGLAISERMRAQIRSLRQGVRNANDGISMIQTAEGGMNEITNILIRFRELSIQGASDTLGDTERSFIDKEVQALKSEIDRIAKSTEFNGRKLLSGEGETMDIQVGINNRPDEDRFVYDPAKTLITTDNLDLSDVNTLTKEDSQTNLEKVDTAINKVAEGRAELGALQNRLQATVDSALIYDENLSAARSRIADLDMAQGTAELVKRNILAQAGTAVLSQANQNNTLALRLIGG